MDKVYKVAVDVDGVLLNFMQSFSEFIQTTYGIEPIINEADTQYSIFCRFPQVIINEIGLKNIKQAFEQAQGWKTLLPMRNSHLVQNLLAHPQFDLHFVTSIAPHLTSDRHYNLCQVLDTHIQLANLHCVPIGTSKKNTIDKLQPDFFVEDNIRNLVECKGYHQSLWIDLKEEEPYEWQFLEKHQIRPMKDFNQAATYILNHSFSFI